MGKLFRTPLLWFVLIGVTLFAIDSHNQTKSNQSILVTQGDLQRIRDQWQAQSGQPVTADMLDALLQELIQERRLYREALALGLDKNDIIVRRRLAQKLRFLTEDLPRNQNRNDGELEAYFDENRQNYHSPAEVSFKHIYFNADLSVQTDIDHLYVQMQQVLSVLQSESSNPSTSNSWKRMGNIFMLGRSFSNRSMIQIRQQFGGEFADKLAGLQIKSWVGPIRSPFGLHLVYIDKYLTFKLMPWIEVREQVELDYRAAQRKDSFSRYLETLAIKYPAIIETASEDVSPSTNGGL